MRARRVLLLAVGLLAYWAAARPRILRWGATDAELAMPLPGDDIVPDAPLVATRAITIDAPPSAVWPWLVQIGQHRAGFYSYTWLENIFGTHMRNADRIVPEWQHIASGDRVWLHPRVSLEVLEVIPDSCLLLAEAWAFVLIPADGGRSTRFVVRGHGRYIPDLKLAPLNFLYWRLIFEPAHFIMECGMLHGIKKRAEASARAPSRTPR